MKTIESLIKGKIDLTKKSLENHLLIDELLYTREYSFSRNFLSLKSVEPAVCSKQIADCEVFSKFVNINSEQEKNIIANIPLKYSKKYAVINQSVEL